MILAIAEAAATTITIYANASATTMTSTSLAGARPLGIYNKFWIRNSFLKVWSYKLS
jgi:hypothetical protein